MPLLCGASVAEVSKYDGAVHLESNKQKMLMGVFLLNHACFASSCVAKYIFIGKLVVLHLCDGSKLRTHY